MKLLFLLIVVAMFVMWVVPILMKAGKKRVLIMAVVAMILLWAGATRVTDEVVILEIQSEVSMAKLKADANISPLLKRTSNSSTAD